MHINLSSAVLFKKLLGVRVVSHIECSKCPPALNKHACNRLRKFWTTLVTGFWGRSFQIISSLVWSSSLVDGWLNVVFILSTKLQNCNADYLRFQFYSETCRRRYLTVARLLSRAEICELVDWWLLSNNTR